MDDSKAIWELREKVTYDTLSTNWFSRIEIRFLFRMIFRLNECCIRQPQFLCDFFLNNLEYANDSLLSQFM